MSTCIQKNKIENRIFFIKFKLFKILPLPHGNMSIYMTHMIYVYMIHVHEASHVCM